MKKFLFFIFLMFGVNTVSFATNIEFLTKETLNKNTEAVPNPYEFDFDDVCEQNVSGLLNVTSKLLFTAKSIKGYEAIVIIRDNSDKIYAARITRLAKLDDEFVSKLGLENGQAMVIVSDENMNIDNVANLLEQSNVSVKKIVALKGLTTKNRPNRGKDDLIDIFVSIETSEAFIVYRNGPDSIYVDGEILGYHKFSF